ncbi:MAG: bifunctional metallophosphatase/5'-nucleotidase [Candidatus Aminicenantes bacterium]|nr:bifunctional metallophosphatase/5'-nucleotidase [Candidatus Aminicenantes bacterium]
MKIKVNDKTIEIFAGARVEDALRKYSPAEWALVRNKEKKVSDRCGHEVGLDGELAEGEELVITAGSRPSRPASRRILIALLGLFALASCRTFPPASSAGRIVIFHSNDVHARIDNFAKVKAILDAERRTGAEVFFFSAGDNFSGNPVVDRYDPPGEPMLELLDLLDVDVLSIGNHEFDYGMEILGRLTSRFRTVSANMEAPPGVLPGLKPWVVLSARGGVNIAVFGVIQVERDSGLPSTHPDKLKGLRFSEPLAKALEMKALRPAAQVLIGLTHIGHDQDLLLARRMPELDVIIGGHSHTRVDKAEKVNGVLVAQAGANNLFLGRVDLWVKNGRVVKKKGRLIDLGKERREDAAVKAAIAEFQRNPALARVVVRAPHEISDKNNLGSLMTDAIREVNGLDVAFQNNGGIRLNRLPLEITLNDIYTLDPFGNPIVEIVMTPAEIRGLIKASFEKDSKIDLQVSGLTYAVRTDEANRVGEIRLRLPDGSPPAEDRTYKVGINSYIASAYRFAHQDPGRSLQTTVADDLIKYLESGADLSIYRDLRRAIWEDPPAAPRRRIG